MHYIHFFRFQTWICWLAGCYNWNVLKIRPWVTFPYMVTVNKEDGSVEPLQTSGRYISRGGNQERPRGDIIVGGASFDYITTQLQQMKQSENFLVWMCPKSSPGPTTCWYFQWAHKYTWTRVYWASWDQFMLLVSQLLQKWLWNVSINRAPAFFFFFSINLQWQCDYYLPFLGQKGSYRLSCKHLCLAWQEDAQFGK